MAPVSDEARKHNQSLPGQGGVYNLVNFQLYHYAGNNPIKYVDPNGELIEWVVVGIVIGAVAVLTGCQNTDIRPLTDSEWNTVQNALSDAKNKLGQIIKQMENDIKLQKVVPLSVKVNIETKTQKLAKKWFGDSSLSFQEALLQDLNKIKNDISSLDRDDFYYDNKTKAYAYVIPSTGKSVYLGKAFFSANKSGWDSQSGILIHEQSHLSLNTEDFGLYGVTNALLLAGSSPTDAKMHADNYEYYYEDY